jgi:DNA-binding NtrC family response regulator
MFAAIQRAPHVDPKVILLIDGHADTRELYSVHLTSVGYQVEDAATTMDAMRRIARHTPDVIVTDLRGPGSDDIQFCRALKGSAVTQDVPLIAITAWADARTACGAREAGCASVLAKPCLPGELQFEIARVLEASRAARRSSASTLRRARALIARAAKLQATAERLLEVAIEQLRSLTQRGLDD